MEWDRLRAAKLCDRFWGSRRKIGGAILGFPEFFGRATRILCAVCWNSIWRAKLWKFSAAGNEKLASIPGKFVYWTHHRDREIMPAV